MKSTLTQQNAINIWIKDYREKHQLSVSEFAQICNITPSAVKEMEAGLIKYPFELLTQLKKNLTADESLSFTRAVTESIKEDFSRFNEMK